MAWKISPRSWRWPWPPCAWPVWRIRWLWPSAGGTDGSQLTSKGLPCPNLPCGTQYAHGRYEFVSVQALTTCKEMVRHLVSADLVKRVMAEKL